MPNLATATISLDILHGLLCLPPEAKILAAREYPSGALQIKLSHPSLPEVGDEGPLPPYGIEYDILHVSQLHFKHFLPALVAPEPDISPPPHVEDPPPDIPGVSGFDD